MFSFPMPMLKKTRILRSFLRLMFGFLEPMLKTTRILHSFLRLMFGFLKPMLKQFCISRSFPRRMLSFLRPMLKTYRILCRFPRLCMHCLDALHALTRSFAYMYAEHQVNSYMVGQKKGGALRAPTSLGLMMYELIRCSAYIVNSCLNYTIYVCKASSQCMQSI